MAQIATPATGAVKSRKALDRAVIRFAGDSGDGMQLTGEQFTTESAWAGNDLATLPNFPAEIRAPAGTLFGVSSFQLQFGSQRVYTPGDRLDCLVAMNPAALKVHLRDLKTGGLLIVNTQAFDKRNLDKAGYAANPLDEPALAERYRLHKVDMTGLTHEAIKDLPLNTKEKDRTKNFFALGLVSWIYTRPLEPTLVWIEKRFAKNKDIAEANTRVLKAGHAFGETAEIFAEHYAVEPAEMAPGLYRAMTGNRALAWGILAAAQRSKVPVVYGAYPITPASDILHELAMHKRFRVRTIQAEDEIAAVTAAIGASFGGAIGVTASSGPGIALKGEGIGLAVTAELPLVVLNIQRAGPSTGMPTKTEQADLMQALYGRNSEAPVVVLAPATPGDCFYIAYEAVRLAAKYMLPVIVLSDGFLANGSEPWLIPDAMTLPPIEIQFRTEREGFFPYLRDPARHARSRASDRRDRKAGRHRQHLLRPGEPRPHGAHARGEGAARGPGDPADVHLRPGDRRPAGRRLGRHLRSDHRGGRAGPDGRQVGRLDPPASPESASAGSRPHPARVPQGAGTRDQQRAAGTGAARRVPRRRRRFQPRARSSAGVRRDS